MRLKLYFGKSDTVFKNDLYIGEIWRSVVGYNGKYMVSTLGPVRNKKGDILKPYPNGCGYLRVGFLTVKK